MGQARTLLLVEDEAIIALNEAMLLRKEGYRVLQAACGEQAIALVNTTAEPIDLILMDINLGQGMNGTQAAQEILKTHDIPIIFLSSHTEPEIVAQTERITSYGYVVKDSSITVLAASIKMAFKLHAAHCNLLRINEKLSLAQEAAHAGAWDWDLVTDQMDWSPEFMKIFGLSPDTTANSATWAQTVHPEDRQRAEYNTSQAVIHKTELTNEYRIILPDGSIRWIRATGKTYAAGDQPLRMIGLCMDITHEKQAETALRESEERMHALFERAPLGYQSLDQDGHFIEVNQAWLETLGYSREDVIGRWFGDFLVGKYVQGFRERFPIFLAHGSIHSEFLMQHKNGDQRWIAFDGRIGHNLDGSFKQTHCILKDETERKQAEERLRQNELTLSTIFNSSRDAIGLSKNGIHLLANPAYVRMFGYDSVAELQGVSILNLIAPECRPAVLENVQRRSLGQPAPAFYETNGLRRDGSTFPMEVGVSTYEDGGQVYTVVTLRDSTERKQAEEALRQANTRLQAIFETTGVAIALTDAYGKWLQANQSFLDLLGYTQEELSNLTNIDLTHPDDAQATIDAICTLLDGEQSSYRLEKRYLHKDGHIVWADISVTAIRDEQDQIVALVGAGADITARKQAEAALQRSLHEKELLMHELQHRVKNSLTISASLLSLEEDNLVDARSRAIFANTQARLRAMAAVYEQLDRGGEIDRIDLHQYIYSLVAAISRSYTLQAGPISIEAQVEAIQLDLKRTLPLGIILNELITNAIKYAFPTSRTAGGGLGTIRVTLAQTAGQVTLCVIDNGIGMPGGISAGSGMGLELVKMLTQQIGGHFTIDGSRGCTACVTFSVE